MWKSWKKLSPIWWKSEIWSWSSWKFKIANYCETKKISNQTYKSGWKAKCIELVEVSHRTDEKNRIKNTFALVPPFPPPVNGLTSVEFIVSHAKTARILCVDYVRIRYTKKGCLMELKAVNSLGIFFNEKSKSPGNGRRFMRMKRRD